MTWQTLCRALKSTSNLFERFGHIPRLHHLKHGLNMLDVQSFVLLPRNASRTSDRVFDLLGHVSIIDPWSQCGGMGEIIVLDARSLYVKLASSLLLR